MSESDLIVQSGSGVNKDTFIEKIAELVSKKLKPQPEIIAGFQNYDLNPPSVPILTSPNTQEPLPYDQKFMKNDDNDQFDQKRLLKYIPARDQKNARQLLNNFSSRGNELNWDSAGLMYIDQNSVPNSDIFHLFPFLFKQRRPKNLCGFDDLLHKIKEMGLLHLIKVRTPEDSNTKLNQEISNSIQKEEKSSNWWYLGP